MRQQMTFDRIADVVVAGAGASGLAAAVMAADQGASVIVIEANHDIGGHAMLSGGNIPLGGGTSLQKKYGIEDSPDLVYLDHTSHRSPQFRHGDRDLVRVWADENVPTVEFLLENGVIFDEEPPEFMNKGTVPRRFRVSRFSDDLSETINGRPGSGLARALERSARAKGVTFLLRHRMTSIVREEASSGRVLGITASTPDGDVTIRASKGLIIATGGHTSNVEFRRMLDPRLTDEYQTAGEPWTPQDASGEIQAMAIGAAFLSSGNQDNGAGPLITKTKHIGCRWGYRNLKWNPKSPMFKYAGASGLTVADYQNLILVNRVGQRFWNEDEDTYAFLAACLGTHGDPGRGEAGANGGGPIWAIFDAAGAEREGWDPNPPNVDPDGWFFSAQTLAELGGKIVNPHQRSPISGQALEATVARYNSFVDAGKDADFGKPGPKYRIDRPPFYAAWSTPILHDSLTGLKIDTKARVVDIQGQVIPGLYCAGESAGGFGLHGLPRVLVFGRIAGREAALAEG
jgi:urocanate reductase